MKKLKLIAAVTIVLMILFAIACNNSKSGAAAYDPVAARNLFNEQGCTACHGVDGSGGMGANLKTGEFATHPIERYREQIANGGNGMPPFKDKLKPEQIDLLAHFIMKEFQGRS